MRSALVNDSISQFTAITGSEHFHPALGFHKQGLK